MAAHSARSDLSSSAKLLQLVEVHYFAEGPSQCWRRGCCQVIVGEDGPGATGTSSSQLPDAYSSLLHAGFTTDLPRHTRCQHALWYFNLA